ncbi:MAG TPA: metal ABC transporter ATP-binding protein [Actinomycetota bacterium]
MSDALVRFEAVSHSYGDGRVLEDLDLEIPPGAFAGIVGPSGAGKTTFLKLVSGAIRPTAGRVVRARSGADLRLALVPQLETIDWTFPVSVEEVVLLGRAAQPRLVPWASKAERRAAHEVLERLGIRDLAARHIADLSGGQQQRAFVARALHREPSLLLMDEPTNGVDVGSRHEMLHLLHELNHDGIAIVLTTHDLNAVAAHVPSLICLNRRVIAAGSPAEILTAETLRTLYGTEMLIVRQDGLLLVGDRPSAIEDEHFRAGHHGVTILGADGGEPRP